MKVLELFAGSRSVGKVCDKLGYEVYSSDIEPFDKIDYVQDILKFDLSKVPFSPDIIWASPPCTAFSVLRIGRNWHKDNTPKTETAVLGVKLVEKTISIIKELNPKFWYMENPRGKLRVLDVVKGLPRVTVWYCRYGDKRAKPTDIWSNNIKSLFNPDGWNPRPECFNGNENCHHDKCPRGNHSGKGGTQGMSGAYNRSMIPEELCNEILTSI
jgi:hypothetical protein